MATYSSNTHDGRCMYLDVAQSGKGFNWTFRVEGGSSSYYSVENVCAYIDGKEIFNYGSKSYRSHEWPTYVGSESGWVGLDNPSVGRTIHVAFYGTVYTSSGSGDDHGGNISYTGTCAFDLNIYDPDGSQPWDTGAAGTVEQSVNGGSYTRVQNETFSSCNTGTTLNYRNFIPGTGRKLSSVSGITPNNTTGPWRVTVNSDINVNFYTAWQTYTISYAANGGSSTPASQTKTYNTNLTLRAGITRNNSTANGYAVTINANGGTYTGTSPVYAVNTTKYTFAGWKSSASGTTYAASATFSENNAATMTAQWTTSVTKGAATLPAASTISRTGYTFAGWNTKSDGTGTNYNAGASFTPSSNITLYAKWTLNAPSAATVTANRANRTRINITCGYTGAALTGYTVYYRANSTGTYSSTSFGTTATGWITGLSPNTTYQIYIRATNAAGSKDSSTTTMKTMANLPTVTAPTISNTLPFDTDVRVNATGDTNAAITNYTIHWGPKPVKNLYDMAIKTMSDGSVWARIFYHYNDQGTVLFTSLAECKNTQQANKYSRLYLLEDNTFKRSGKFEFMLTYPNNSAGYNRWKQTNAPQNEFVTETTAGTGTATGYEAVHIDWSANYWGGLTRQAEDVTSYNPCYLSGSVGHANWYYAIGASVTHGDGIPASASINGNGSTSSCVELWVRIDDETTDSKSLGNSATGNVDGLSEETEYMFWGQATNDGGTATGPMIVVVTPADQAKVRIKTNGGWEKGKLWYKSNGEWVKAKKVYIKINGQWVIGSNYEN